MANACPSSAGAGARARDCASYCQGVEASWPIDPAQNETQREIKPQKTPRDGAEHGEGEMDEQGMGYIRTILKTFRTGRGLRRRLSLAGGGADVWATEEGRGIK